ncbi:MAG: hypothetical protein K9H48_21800 [Melioribacteraceae bacterium]|nr:hypothetical protein [Melioribacteraceae bacterium]
MKKCYLLSLLLISTLVYAQQSNFYFTTADLGDTSQVRVECKDGEKVILKNTKIENKAIIGLSEKGQNTNIKLIDIIELRTIRGHYGYDVGFICSLIIGVSVEIATMEETDYTVEINWPATILGSVVGYGVGYIMGKSIPKWRTVYKADEFGYNNGIIPFNIYAGEIDKYWFAGLSYKF